MGRHPLSAEEDNRRRLAWEHSSNDAQAAKRLGISKASFVQWRRSRNLGVPVPKIKEVRSPVNPEDLLGSLLGIVSHRIPRSILEELMKRGGAHTAEAIQEWGIGAPASIYRYLRAFEEFGVVETGRQLGAARRSKRTYAITDRGYAILLRLREIDGLLEGMP